MVKTWVAMRGLCLAHWAFGFGFVKPSPPRPRESAQWIPDVINLEPEPVSKGVKVMGVLCRS